ncbi:MAG: transposase [Gammaproteobacteria bacterium]|nr:transposase [Gammaproteobacteria bacterium]
MAQYSAERRESVVRKLLSQPDRPIRELSQETGVSTWTLYDWRRQARNQGETAVGSTKHSGKWSAAQKLSVIAETSAMNEAELAEYCRSKGLYVEQLKTWRAEALKAMGGGMVSAQEHRAALDIGKKRIRELERELHRKEKALAETAALLTLRKNV